MDEGLPALGNPFLWHELSGVGDKLSDHLQP
jgi:hypothetical protein